MLSNALAFSTKEKKVIYKIENYFKSKQMSFQDKLFHALLIAQHDLEAHHFSNEIERQNIVEFKEAVDSILQKLG